MTAGTHFAVIDPKGRCIGVFTTGTGRAGGTEATHRVRRALLKTGVTRKRTSRPRPGASTKRTSKRR